jgi:uncharacterized RDD family membrane protein YckC
MKNENLISSEQRQDNNGIPSDKLVYAGFWRRFGAYWIDFLILLPLLGLSFWLGEKFRLFNLYYFFPGVLISLFFHVWLVKRYGGTPGKLVLKIKIARLDGSPVGYREAIMRHSILFILSTLVSLAMVIASYGMSDPEYLSLSFIERSIKLSQLAPPWYQTVNILLNVWIWSEFIIMLTNKKRRAIHDFMAGTVVIRNT